MEMTFWHIYNETDKKRRHFEYYHQTKGLFIEESLHLEIRKLADMMWDSLNEARFEKEYPNPRAGRYEKAEKLRLEGPFLRDTIEKMIKAKLWEKAGV